jgi:hypothetical protein
MSTWQLIFFQSKANHGFYDEDRLPTQNWAWPQKTWFQKRRDYLRENQRGRARRREPSKFSNRAAEVAFADQREARPAAFSVMPLLLAAKAREGLLEGRRQDAAGVLMQEYGLSCGEASQTPGSCRVRLECGGNAYYQASVSTLEADAT